LADRSLAVDQVREIFDVDLKTAIGDDSLHWAR
jgi:hypothetical protein